MFVHLLILFLVSQFWNADARRPGLRTSMKDSYGLIGGEDIDITEAPHHVAVLDKGVFIRSGALIAKNVVLTLASVDELPSLLSSSKVRAGSPYIEYGGEYVAVKKVVTLPYFEDMFGYSLALLWLEEPLKTSHKIALIEMMNQGDEVNDGETTQLTGWGMTVTTDFPSQLQRVTLQAMNATRCNDFTKSYVSPRVMCAGDTDGKGACRLDLGDPLVYKGKLAGLWLEDYNCADPDIGAQFYAKISSMTKRINDIIYNITNNE